MPVSSLEKKDSPENNAEPGSGIDVAAPHRTREQVSVLFVARHATSVSKQDDGAGSGESGADSELLSNEDRQALFSGLQAILQRPENDDSTSAQWNTIEQALLQNPRMMRHLKRLQNMGAELVVEFQEGYLEFSDAADNLDIPKQEDALMGLTAEERDNAIEQILQPLSGTQRESARVWILSQLKRSEGARGLNWVEGLLLAVAHGGVPISHGKYNAMARKNQQVYERTWTWHLENLREDLLSAMKHGLVQGSKRHRGKADRIGASAGGRYGNQGVRIAGLRVQVS